MKKNKTVLIVDLDNTIYDWVSYFVPSFYAMVEVAVQIIGCNKDELLDDLQKVHQFHHDSEHPFALLETKTIKETYIGKSSSQIKMELDPAFYAFNKTRKENLHLYDSVFETLQFLNDKNIKIVAYTESKYFSVIDRLRKLRVDHFFKKVYCREKAQTLHPENKSLKEWLQDFPIEKIVELSKHKMKPDVDVLLEICENENIPTNEAIYIGDSIPKDVFMANQAGITSVWAKYGSVFEKSLYQKLIRISHWTPEDIKREVRMAKLAENTEANLIADESFSQILPLFKTS